ncbi:MAG: RluA family pseudouridine synthase [bacterium]|nr:RluA family pseudouridine synthase [bacterium]
MEPTIIYEDEAILAINKPSGLIVYPDGKHDYPALSTWLETRLDSTSSARREKYGKDRFHFVHRIDRETSGILLVAKTEAAHAFLKQQFAERDIKKTYRAFVYGGLKDDRGIIERPIGSARGGLGPRSATRPHGTTREAITAYSVRARSSNPPGVNSATYVDVFPKTGRTHQIRVHFSAIQHPVICDVLYAPTRAPLLGFKRLALHALSLTFTHPNGREVTLEAPLPTDFLAAEKELRKE